MTRAHVGTDRHPADEDRAARVRPGRSNRPPLSDAWPQGDHA